MGLYPQARAAPKTTRIPERCRISPKGKSSVDDAEPHVDGESEVLFMPAIEEAATTTTEGDTEGESAKDMLDKV